MDLVPYSTRNVFIDNSKYNFYAIFLTKASNNSLIEQVNKVKRELANEKIRRRQKKSKDLVRPGLNLGADSPAINVSQMDDKKKLKYSVSSDREILGRVSEISFSSGDYSDIFKTSITMVNCCEYDYLHLEPFLAAMNLTNSNIKSHSQLTYNDIISPAQPCEFKSERMISRNREKTSLESDLGRDCVFDSVKESVEEPYVSEMPIEKHSNIEGSFITLKNHRSFIFSTKNDDFQTKESSGTNDDVNQECEEKTKILNNNVNLINMRYENRNEISQIYSPTIRSPTGNSQNDYSNSGISKKMAHLDQEVLYLKNYPIKEEFMKTSKLPNSMVVTNYSTKSLTDLPITDSIDYIRKDNESIFRRVKIINNDNKLKIKGIIDDISDEQSQMRKMSTHSSIVVAFRDRVNEFSKDSNIKSHNDMDVAEFNNKNWLNNINVLNMSPHELSCLSKESLIQCTSYLQNYINNISMKGSNMKNEQRHNLAMGFKSGNKMNQIKDNKTNIRLRQKPAHQSNERMRFSMMFKNNVSSNGIPSDDPLVMLYQSKTISPITQPSKSHSLDKIDTIQSKKYSK